MSEAMESRCEHLLAESIALAKDVLGDELTRKCISITLCPMLITAEVVHVDQTTSDVTCSSKRGNIYVPASLCSAHKFKPGCLVELEVMYTYGRQAFFRAVKVLGQPACQAWHVVSQRKGGAATSHSQPGKDKRKPSHKETTTDGRRRAAAVLVDRQ